MTFCSWFQPCLVSNFGALEQIQECPPPPYTYTHYYIPWRLWEIGFPRRCVMVAANSTNRAMLFANIKCARSAPQILMCQSTSKMIILERSMEIFVTFVTWSWWHAANLAGLWFSKPEQSKVNGMVGVVGSGLTRWGQMLWATSLWLGHTVAYWANVCPTYALFKNIAF